MSATSELLQDRSDMVFIQSLVSEIIDKIFGENRPEPVEELDLGCLLVHQKYKSLPDISSDVDGSVLVQDPRKSLPNIPLAQTVTESNAAPGLPCDTSIASESYVILNDLPTADRSSEMVTRAVVLEIGDLNTLPTEVVSLESGKVQEPLAVPFGGDAEVSESDFKKDLDTVACSLVPDKATRGGHEDESTNRSTSVTTAVSPRTRRSTWRSIRKFFLRMCCCGCIVQGDRDDVYVRNV